MAAQSIIVRKRQDLAELELFASICGRALRQASKAVEAVELQVQMASALGEPSPFETSDALDRAKADAAKTAAFAASQTEGGSPYLYGLCAVRLWALLEALVDELTVEAMHDPSKCADQVLLGKLKGPLVEFRAASAGEQAEYLAETLKQTVDAPLKLGVGRFEAVLAPVGLGGAVDDSVRKSLFELSQVRNVIIHKGGKADRRLVDACPWLGLARGAAVDVTEQMFEGFQMASYWYLLELSGRQQEREGKRRTPELLKAHAMLIERLRL